MKRFPQVRRPRWRYRKARHLQDTIVLELHVPAALIPWLEFFGMGYGAEDSARFHLTSEIARLQGLQWTDGVWGGRPAAKRVRAEVAEFLALPTNCGPPKVSIEDAIGPVAPAET